MPPRTRSRRDDRPIHPRRYHAAVETLDARRLMAASITGTVIPITGVAGSPLRVEEGALGSVGIGGFSTPDFPIGQPVPLVLLTSSDPTSTLASTGLSGTVNWGDGMAADAAQFSTNPSYTFANIDPNQLYINGPEHTYAAPGNYTITVTLTTPGSATPTTFTDRATISLPITGQLIGLNPFLSATATPTLTGATEPGATVVLTAVSSPTKSLIVGTGVADASGNWSITTASFVDGIYEIDATVSDTAGHSGSATLYTLGPFTSDALTIDAAVPTVVGFNITNAKTGAFQVTYSDPSGIELNGITAASSYAVTRPSPALKKGQSLSITSLTETDGEGTATVAGTLSAVKPLLARNGTYIYTIRGAGITSETGKALDGKFTGRFPSGDGQPGGNFQVKITVRNGKVVGMTPTMPAKVTARAAQPKVPARHHA